MGPQRALRRPIGAEPTKVCVFEAGKIRVVEGKFGEALNLLVRAGLCKPDEFVSDLPLMCRRTIKRENPVEYIGARVGWVRVPEDEILTMGQVSVIVTDTEAESELSGSSFATALLAVSRGCPVMEQWVELMLRGGPDRGPVRVEVQLLAFRLGDA